MRHGLSFPVVPLLVLAVILTAGAVPTTAGDAAAAPASVQDGVVAFYFHGNVRCATCRKIEAYAHEAIHSGFSAELEEGALDWRVVNVDEPENRHFIEDFQLATRSVVLAEYRAGELVRFERLDKVWQLVRSQDRFVDYVQQAAHEFLGES